MLNSYLKRLVAVILQSPNDAVTKLSQSGWRCAYLRATSCNFGLCSRLADFHFQPERLDKLNA